MRLGGTVCLGNTFRVFEWHCVCLGGTVCVWVALHVFGEPCACLGRTVCFGWHCACLGGTPQVWGYRVYLESTANSVCTVHIWLCVRVALYVFWWICTYSAGTVHVWVALCMFRWNFMLSGGTVFG